MSKTWLVTPAFCKAAMLEDCLKQIYRSSPNVPHVILDQHYPVSKDANRAEIKRLADAYGCIYIDSGKDLGLHKGLNLIVKEMGIGPDDIMVGCDPDDRPTPGFVQAIETVMRSDPSFAVLATNFWVIDWRKSQGASLQEEVIAGHAVWVHKSVEMWNICGWNMRLIHDVGGFNQPNAYYGGIEAMLYPEWKARGMRLGYIRDFRSDEGERLNPADARIFDPEYRQYKTDHVAGFPGSFSDWLKANKPEKL